MATRAISLDDGFVPSFDEEWPELARRLDRFLAAKGVDEWLRSDILQETAARLYSRWPTLDHSRPLWNLVVTVALRIVHDHRRKDARVEFVAEPIPLHGDDVDLRGLQRLQLGKTRSALQRLTPDQRRVLLAEVGEASLPAGTRNRVNVLRLRARASLKEALGPWAPAGVALRMPSLRTAIERHASEWGQHAATLTASLAHLAVAATLLLPGAGADGVTPMPHGFDGKRSEFVGAGDTQLLGSQSLGGRIRVSDLAPRVEDTKSRGSRAVAGPMERPKEEARGGAPGQDAWIAARDRANSMRDEAWDRQQKEWNRKRKEVNEASHEAWDRQQKEWNRKRKEANEAQCEILGSNC